MLGFRNEYLIAFVPDGITGQILRTSESRATEQLPAI